jgi:hypothetical protein
MEPLTGEGHPHPKFPMELSPRELARRALPPKFPMELSPGGSPLSRGVWSLAKVYIILLSDTTTIHLFRGKRDAPKGVILFSGSIGKMGWG